MRIGKPPSLHLYMIALRHDLSFAWCTRVHCILKPTLVAWIIVSTSEPDVSRLARRMKELRAEQGLTYEQLAEASGLSRRGVIALETGERGSTVAVWHKVAHALGVTSAEFFGILD